MFMSDFISKDIMVLGRQLQFSYSTNRRSENPIQFHACGITGQIKTRLDSIGDYKNWDVGWFYPFKLHLIKWFKNILYDYLMFYNYIQSITNLIVHTQGLILCLVLFTPA